MRFKLLILVCLAACGPEPERCEQRDLAHYDEALSGQLTRNGVPHSTRPRKGVCVAAKDAPRMDQAARQVDGYFHEVAYLLEDACEEPVLVEWAKRAGLRFEVRSTTSGRRMFLLRSFSKEEVAVNLRRLHQEAPRGACPKKGS